jgi:hypothetical protein
MKQAFPIVVFLFVLSLLGSALTGVGLAKTGAGASLFGFCATAAVALFIAVLVMWWKSHPKEYPSVFSDRDEQ